MATWHQKRAGNDRPFAAPNKWTVFINPPNDMCSSVIFDNLTGAEQYKTNLLRHHLELDPQDIRIIPPARSDQ